MQHMCKYQVSSKDDLVNHQQTMTLTIDSFTKTTSITILYVIVIHIIYVLLNL